MAPCTLLVFSHLRWSFVYQRPQQLLSRMARQARVLFVEEPMLVRKGPPRWDLSSPIDGLTVAQPQIAAAAGGFHDDHCAVLRPMIRELLRESRGDLVVWFYTPLALPLIEGLEPRLVIYDCMDALDTFLNAPSAMQHRERELLARAQLVFTGGPSLYRRLQSRHADVHCFPSSVEAGHFAKARGACSDPADQGDIPHPRLGYYGVIDERIDLPLLEAIATMRPQWQWVMVGPVVKISEDSLPRRPNLHYLGQKHYQELPQYLSGWDVCLMPFARNKATRYISPTKVLEYMAAERPIVSTSIRDVAEPYSSMVYLGDTAEEFVAGCQRALSAAPEERAERTAQMRSVLARTSWDLTARGMMSLIEDRLEQRSAARALTAGRPVRSPASTPPVLIAGAGPTGLSAAYHLGKDALLLEQHDRPGGLCRSLQINGFTFDYAGHIMFSNDSYVHRMYDLLLGDNVHWQDREAWVYSKNVYTRYPFQGALYGLPPHVIKECIVGAIEARFGPLTAPLQTGPANGKPARANGPARSAVEPRAGRCRDNGERLEDCCADGIIESTAPLMFRNGNGRAAAEPRNFEEFIYQVWGAGIAKHFAVPYNRKLWAVPLSEMETSWLGGRVPLPDLEEMIEGALQPVPKPMGPNARFGYPLRGGFQALMDGFLPHIGEQFQPNSRLARVSAARRTVTLQDGRELPYEHLISTIPLPVLIRALGPEAPEYVLEATRKLRYVSVRSVHLGIGRENLTTKHWIYYPEHTVFHRIFVQGNASPFCNPPGGFGLTCEITYSPHKPLPCEGDDLIQRCIEDCREVGMIGADDPIWAATQVDLPHAYVVYDHARAGNVAVIREWLAGQNIVLAGRYSEWEYYNSDHAFLAGRRAAERVAGATAVAARA